MREAGSATTSTKKGNGHQSMMEERNRPHASSFSPDQGFAGRSSVDRACKRKHNIVEYNIAENTYIYIYIYIYILFYIDGRKNIYIYIYII